MRQLKKTHTQINKGLLMKMEIKLSQIMIINREITPEVIVKYYWNCYR